MSAFERFLHLRGPDIRAAAIDPDGELIVRTPAQMRTLIGAQVALGYSPVDKAGDDLGSAVFVWGNASGGASESQVYQGGMMSRSNANNKRISIDDGVLSFWDYSGGNRHKMEHSGGHTSIDCELNATGFSVAGTPVVGTRKTGWSAATGTATRSTFATGSVTTAQLAERVKALIDDLISHGLIGS